jgi:hypothetical protein
VEAPAAVLRESSTKVVMELIRSRMEVVLKPLQSCSKDVTKRTTLLLLYNMHGTAKYAIMPKTPPSGGTL